MKVEYKEILCRHCNGMGKINVIDVPVGTWLSVKRPCEYTQQSFLLVTGSTSKSVKCKRFSLWKTTTWDRVPKWIRYYHSTFIKLKSIGKYYYIIDPKNLPSDLVEQLKEFDTKVKV